VAERFPIDTDVPLLSPDHPVDAFEQSGLARAIVPKKPNNLTAPHFTIDAFEHRNARISGLDAHHFHPIINGSRKSLWLKGFAMIEMGPYHRFYRPRMRIFC